MMAQAEENSEMLTRGISDNGGNIELANITEHDGNMTRMASEIERSTEKKEDAQNNDGQVEEIDKWVDSLERLLEDVPSYMCTRGHPGRISRIPETLRDVDAKGYEPTILSMGPYHHGKPRLEQMETRKKLVLRCVLQNKPELTLKDYLKEIISIEAAARSFYSDVEMDDENFVRMMLLDSVYIVTTFFGMAKSRERINEMGTRGGRSDNDDANSRATQINEEKGTGTDDENLKMLVSAGESTDGMTTGENWYWGLFTHDLFLIENQIPLFVLQKIHNFAYGVSGTQFMDTMKYEVANMLAGYTRQDPNMISLKTDEIHHILHLCHKFFHPTNQQVSTASNFAESSQMFRLGSTVQLYESGVHFEARSCSTNYSLLDITFDKRGKLEMPCLIVDDNTESLLRNLIALEQMKYPSLGLNVSAYIVLLLHLITIPKDVELLRRKGIIQHHLASDKEMMYLVNRLSTGLAFDYVEDKYSLKHVFHELKHYSERRVPWWRAWLKHRHCSNPWTAISLLVASLLLLLTVVQTFYTVYSYYFPYFNGHY